MGAGTKTWSGGGLKSTGEQGRLHVHRNLGDKISCLRADLTTCIPTQYSLIMDNSFQEHHLMFKLDKVVDLQRLAELGCGWVALN